MSISMYQEHKTNFEEMKEMVKKYDSKTNYDNEYLDFLRSKDENHYQNEDLLIYTKNNLMNLFKSRKVAESKKDKTQVQEINEQISFFVEKKKKWQNDFENNKKSDFDEFWYTFN